MLRCFKNHASGVKIFSNKNVIDNLRTILGVMASNRKNVPILLQAWRKGGCSKLMRYQICVNSATQQMCRKCRKFADFASPTLCLSVYQLSSLSFRKVSLSFSSSFLTYPLLFPIHTFFPSISAPPPALHNAFVVWKWTDRQLIDNGTQKKMRSSEGQQDT